MTATLDSKWPQVGQAVQQGVSAGTKKAADKMLSRMIGELNAPKSGRVYHGHRASAPGESPASDTGALEESLDVLPSEDGKGHAVASDSPVAPILEFGGKNMARRPLFSKVAADMEEESPEIIANEIRAAVSKI